MRNKINKKEKGRVKSTQRKSIFSSRHFLLSNSGYSSTNTFANFVINTVTSTLMLLLAAPVFLLVPIIIKWQDGGPIFYRGTRLGRDKKLFNMYKFRTLVVDAESTIGDQLLKANHHLETPFGKVLRETRLDELPQLFNVLRGDMDIVGPRPERPQVYQKMCKEIPGYDMRFEVKPGLIGYSQLFTPHSAPKKVRTLIDNFYIRRKHRVITDIKLFIYAFCILLVHATIRFANAAARYARMLLKSGRLQNQRQFQRIEPITSCVVVHWTDESSTGASKGNILDINDEAMLIEVSNELPENTELEITATIDHRPFLANRTKVKTVRCVGTLVIRKSPTDATVFKQCLVRYTPSSPLNEFKLHKYFLNKSIA